MHCCYNYTYAVGCHNIPIVELTVAPKKWEDKPVDPTHVHYLVSKIKANPAVSLIFLIFF